MVAKAAGDEGADLCTLADHICILSGGYQCPTYEEYLQELQAEETAEIESLKADYQREQEARERYYSTDLLNSPFTCVSGDIERDSPDTIEPPARGNC